MIKVKNLTKYFWENKVLDDVSFEIKPWEICGFIWENGAGKSTTMRILSTLILDYEWEVLIDWKKLNKNLEKTRQIVWFMPDQYGLYDDMSLWDYLDFFRISYWFKSSRKKVEKVLKQVSLENKIDDNIWNLSRWMTQRICLARALITEPKILILDEPASGLDPKLRIELKNLLLKLKDKWTTIFVSSHILNELAEYCDSIIFIEWWKIIKSWNISELSKKTENKSKLLKINSLDFIKIKKLLEENNIDFEEIEEENNLEEIYLNVMK